MFRLRIPVEKTDRRQISRIMEEIRNIDPSFKFSYSTPTSELVADYLLDTEGEEWIVDQVAEMFENTEDISVTAFDYVELLQR